MTCEKVRERLDALVDHELPWWTTSAVRRHTRRCAACNRELAEIQRLTQVARTWSTVEAPPELRDRVMAAARAEGLVEATPGLPTARRRRRVALIALPAAAA